MKAGWWMKSSRKLEQTASLILKSINDVIYKDLEDELAKLACLQSVIMSKDNTIANVYVTFLPSKKNKYHLLTHLKESAGRIRYFLAKRLITYKVPEIRFNLDLSGEYASHIEEIITKIHS
jgi:ribosome-binding factor A